MISVIRAAARYIFGQKGPVARPAYDPQPTFMPHPLPSVVQAATVQRALSVAGVTNDSVETVAFYERQASSFIDYRELRKKGRLLNAEEKRALSIKTRAHVGDEFARTLNDRGLADIQEAAARVAFALNAQRQSVTDISRRASAGSSYVRFFASNMAAGPCAPAANLGGSVMPLERAPLLPLEGCSHPDQCACRLLPPDR